jgi:hypothetical protein
MDMAAAAVVPRCSVKQIIVIKYDMMVKYHGYDIFQNKRFKRSI